MSVRTGELRKSTGWESERPAITPGPIDRANARGNRLRVAFFVETPHRLTGAPRSLLAALSRIEDYGIDPLVVFPASGIVEEAFRAAGVRTRVVQAPPTLLLFNKQILKLGSRARLRALAREFLPYNLRLRQVLEEEGASVVHYNTPRGILVAGLAARLARRPVCLHVRGSVAPLGRLWTACQASADRMIFVAEALTQEVSWPFRSRSTVVYNGISALPMPDRGAARAALARRLGRSGLDDTTVFVSLSSFTPFKGIHHLLEATAIVRGRGVPVVCVLAGSGEDAAYRRYLESLVEQRGLHDAVHFLGFVEDPLELLAGADALVLSTVREERLEMGGEVRQLRCSEGLPRVVLEAMALGLPSIATDVAGVREQLDDGATGRVVRPSDPEALADAMVFLTENVAWRSRAGERAREVVLERFTVERSAEGMARVLRTLAHHVAQRLDACGAGPSAIP